MVTSHKQFINGPCLPRKPGHGPTVIQQLSISYHQDQCVPRRSAYIQTQDCVSLVWIQAPDRLACWVFRSLYQDSPAVRKTVESWLARP